MFGLSSFDLLLGQGLLLAELLNNFLINRSFQMFFNYSDYLFQLYSSSFILLKQLARFILDWLEPMSHFHDFSLCGVDLLLSHVLLLDIFILSTIDRSFKCYFTDDAFFFASWSRDSIFFNSRSLVRSS
jgi:hypothetical protein